ncbi:glycine--tRNA ligase subunit alpha [Buchnera aphidicola (Thelaxes californica)]|uniref:Glycine--tRNA ligase alpha subunit n=1 Tax=Buchnera aphidicola (Thelaxes californica) TaxID=1315998 RepID=A0A4D6YL34_9GAMM|nr:glycine--tRNA ligase subunit alpha [Buchnera aphidicola]QCI26660.1 glycine--tRNA ligase subunit alpha [Buchnera aphidicola (Thelaxes californica)]
MLINKKKNFWDILQTLINFWNKKGVIPLQSIDTPVGAGTFHPETFFKSIGPNPYSNIYVQPCRRPSDGRYGINPNRLQYYYQLQLVIKPAPINIQEMYLNSLKKINISLEMNDIRFIEDNWENPTLGASGVGWEVWINGMEITQFTYFQNVGGTECNPVTVEITYGLERICMHIQNKKSIYDCIWMNNKNYTITYRDLFYKNEKEQSQYNFIYSDTKLLINLFQLHKKECKRLLTLKNPLIFPAYEHFLYANHNFNLIEAKKIFSVTERQKYILQLRMLSKLAATIYLNKYS